MILAIAVVLGFHTLGAQVTFSPDTFVNSSNYGNCLVDEQNNTEKAFVRLLCWGKPGLPFVPAYVKEYPTIAITCSESRERAVLFYMPSPSQPTQTQSDNMSFPVMTIRFEGGLAVKDIWNSLAETPENTNMVMQNDYLWHQRVILGLVGLSGESNVKQFGDSFRLMVRNDVPNELEFSWGSKSAKITFGDKLADALADYIERCSRIDPDSRMLGF